MNAITATIFVDTTQKDPSIYVQYDQPENIPPQHRNIRQVARRCFESGTIHGIRQQLNEAIPGIRLRIAYIPNAPLLDRQ